MSRPNILCFCADELMRSALNCYGAKFIQSPNIDRIAQSGTRFARHYTNSPLCVPSRGVMITGRYVHEVGAWDNGHPYIGTPKGWSHHLRDAGYETASIGKNHFRSVDDDNGFDQELLPMHVRWGIGDIFGMLRDEKATYPTVEGEPGAAPVFGPAMMAATAGPGESNHTEYDREITQAACDWLKRRKNVGNQKPWALYVSYVSPHFPLRAPQEFFDLYADLDVPPPYHYAKDERPKNPAIRHLMDIWNYDDFFDEATVTKARRAYYALVSFLDFNIGRVLEAAASLGEPSDTLVIFTSDHGEMLGSKGIWSTSAMYEDSTGVPLIIAGPGFDRAKVVETLTSHIDLAPTLLAAAGVPVAPGMRGRALQDIAARPLNDDRVIFSEYHAGGSNTGFFMICKSRYKYILYVGYEAELFDLRDDPLEAHDLAGNPEYGAVVRGLDAELRRILDPAVINRMAFASQRATVEKHGGRDAVRRRGHPGEHSLDRHLGYE